MSSIEKIDTRTLDELGRIVVPSKVRSKFGWGVGDKITMYYAGGNTLMLQSEKYEEPKCIFCGSAEAFETVQEKQICGGCLEKIRAG